MEPSGVSVEVTKSCTNKDHCQSTTDGTNSGDFWYRFASDIAIDMLSDHGFAREMQWEFKKDFSASTGDIQ